MHRSVRSLCAVRRATGNLRLRPPLTAVGQVRGVYGRPRALQSVHLQRAAPGWVVGTCVVRTPSLTRVGHHGTLYGGGARPSHAASARYTGHLHHHTRGWCAMRALFLRRRRHPRSPRTDRHHRPLPSPLAVSQYHHPPSVTTGRITSPAHMPRPRLHTRRHGLQYSFSLLPTASTHTRRTTPLRPPPSPSPPQCRPTPAPPPFHPIPHPCRRPQ